MRHEESSLQRSCVLYFKYKHPDIEKMLFAVPNGGARSRREAAIMKGEGVTAGVADCILLVPRGAYASLCLEFKTETGRQSDSQKTWQKEAEANGNKYVVIRSFDQFETEVESYLKGK